MTNTQRAANSMMELTRTNFEELNRETGLFLAPVAKMRNHILAKPFFGITDSMSDAEVVSLMERASGKELVTAEVEGKLMVVRAAEKWELASDDAYHAIMDPAEVEAQAAYDRVLAETDDEDVAREAYDAIYYKAEEKALEAARDAEEKALEEDTEDDEDEAA